jgi:V-type H+-transporting ATPase subunit D
LQLLKKKADALTMRFRQILSKILEAKANLGTTMKSSFFAYTEAQYSAGEKIKHTIADNVEGATVKVNTELDNVAGVKIPRFKVNVIPGETKMDLAGE